MNRLILFLNSWKYKNNKFVYYVKSFFMWLAPGFIVGRKLSSIKNALAHTGGKEREYIESRVNYYNKLSAGKTTRGMAELKDLSFFKNKAGSVYFFDAYRYIRLFPKNYKASFAFGDVTEVPEIPSIVKSRPINGDNQNSVVLKLNRVRHFLFVKDHKKFEDKKNLLIGRAYVYQKNRIEFWQKYFNNPLCDLGQLNAPDKTKHPEWTVKPTTIGRHLDYKFILCLEGNDVATNLKWVMSSNSLAVMPRPKYETWFMEGTLRPDVHYLCIKDDYSDLEERLNFYIQHPEQARKITAAAHAYVEQFKDEEREDVISYLTLEKYFRTTGQTK